MMYNYPFFNFPSFRRYTYRPTEDHVSAYSGMSNSTHNSYNSRNYSRKINKNSNNLNSNSKPNVNTNFKLNSQTISNKKDSEDRQELFDFLGIKLYFDDVLLICLIFFLYNVGVKDQYLFISLIMLLLS